MTFDCSLSAVGSLPSARFTEKEIDPQRVKSLAQGHTAGKCGARRMTWEEVLSCDGGLPGSYLQVSEIFP